MRVRLDEETLKTIANKTRAEYFYAGTATDLKKVYQSLNSKFLLEKKPMEISALFAAAAAIAVLVSALLSLLWFHRILIGEHELRSRVSIRITLGAAKLLAMR